MWSLLLRAARTHARPHTRLGSDAARLCTARSFASARSDLAAPLRVIQGRATELWDSIIEAEWIDSTSIGAKTEEVDKVVEDYRSLYNAVEVESSSEARKVYEAVEQLYVVGEAAKLVELYADHMTELVRHHMDLTGFLGNDTALTPEDAERAEKTLKEYIEFVNSIENNRIRRKVEAQLGRKAIQLRQALSIDGFAIKAMPVATDRIVTSLKARPDGSS